MQNTAGCPKCGGGMDEGKISDSKTFYTSDKSPAAFFSMPIIADIHRARACLTCGYLEMYVDPIALVKKIAAV